MGVNAGNWDFAVVAGFDSIDHQIIYRTVRSTSV
jgi:hypothetical protein